MEGKGETSPYPSINLQLCNSFPQTCASSAVSATLRRRKRLGRLQNEGIGSRTCHCCCYLTLPEAFSSRYLSLPIQFCPFLHRSTCALVGMTGTSGSQGMLLPFASVLPKWPLTGHFIYFWWLYCNNMLQLAPIRFYSNIQKVNFFCHASFQCAGFFVIGGKIWSCNFSLCCLKAVQFYKNNAICYFCTLELTLSVLMTKMNGLIDSEEPYVWSSS